MKQITPFADSRMSFSGCVYCGAAPETRDHVPSRVLLDDPFPENLPVVHACFSCNQSFSRNEEYLACLLEAVLIGDTAVTSQMRPKVQKILTNRPSLTARIRNSSVGTREQPLWMPESERIENVIQKLAQGHAAYDLSLPLLGKPRHIAFVPMPLMSDSERIEFERSPEPGFWPEVGTRAMIRAATSWPNQPGSWVVVQPQRYRYALASFVGITVRIVLSEYLACEVRWDEDSYEIR